MLNLKKPYQDVFGVRHESPLIVIQTINYNQQQTRTLSAERTDLGFEHKNVDAASYITVGFTASLFTSEEAFINKCQSLPLRNPQGGEYFSFQADAPISESELVAACENWLLENFFR